MTRAARDSTATRSRSLACGPAPEALVRHGAGVGAFRLWVVAVTRYLDLGSLEVVVNDERRTLGGRIPAAVLSVLLVNLNRRVELDSLAEIVWADGRDHRSTLQSHVWRLRSVLEVDRAPARGSAVTLVNDGRGYRLVAPVDTVDSFRFEQLEAEASQLLRTDQPQRALRRAEEALSLWRGAPVDGVADDGWAAPVIAKWNALRGQVERHRIEALLAVGDPGQALSTLEVLLGATPLDEVLWGQRMVAEYRSGRIDAALQSFRRASRLLDDELGVVPSRDLQDLHRRILSQDPTLQPPPSALGHPVRVAAAVDVHLPPPRGRVIGRTDDVDRLSDLIRGGRLTTVVGAAGCGKTTVAVTTARGLVEEFVDGIWFVDLTPTAQPAQVLAAFATSLRLAIPPTGSERDALRTYVRGRRMLLVVDNAEHVVEPAAELLTELLGEGDELSVVVTSRVPLMLDDEQEYPLSPLELPAPDRDISSGQLSASVELFLQRLPARTRDQLTTDQLQMIEEICVLLDGLPLAIELAATRHRAFSLAEIADQVRSDASQLRAVDRGRPDHHQTVRSAIDWSYRLLDPAEQAVHRRLALVPGATTAAAAAALTGRPVPETEGLLASLVHRSLVTPRFPENAFGVTRFTQLATVRAHADYVLGDDEREAAHHGLDEFVEQLLSSRGRRGRPEEAAWMEALDNNLDALRATLRRHLIDRPSARGVDLFTRVGIYWYFRGRMVESRRWQTAIATVIDSTDPLLRALMEVGFGAAQCWRSRGDLARQPILAALQRTDHPDADNSIRWGEQIAIVGYSTFAAREAELGQLMAHRLTRIARTTDDADLTALAAGCTILAGAMNDDPDDVLRRAGELHQQTVATDNVLARWFIADGATAAAIAVDDADSGLLWSDRAARACLRLRIDEGSVLFEQRANVFALGKQFAQAARLYAGAQRHQHRNGLTTWNFARTADLLEQTRTALGPTGFAAVWEDGREVTLEQTFT